MRILFLMGALVAVAACGGGVSGTIGEACIDADRRAASPALCSCVQQVADQTLSNRDQQRAAAFFAQPQLAQDTRQSDNAGSEAFWRRYKTFTDRARTICRPVA
ncbi:arginine transporter [Yoonia sp. SS1-5]|uniref:Arginine transporter n=1 Tax=Yoonia rhodophyticola TaxID=3137370 RepID=A0AAN0MFA9_9RHOB